MPRIIPIFKENNNFSNEKKIDGRTGGRLTAHETAANLSNSTLADRRCFFIIIIPIIIIILIIIIIIIISTTILL